MKKLLAMATGILVLFVGIAIFCVIPAGVLGAGYLWSLIFPAFSGSIFAMFFGGILALSSLLILAIILLLSYALGYMVIYG